MKIVLTGLAFGMLLALTPTQHASAQESGAPEWMKQTYPPAALNSAWEEYKAVSGPGALDAKSKELIGLAVAAQIPCQYCVYYHTLAAKHDGATDAQIKEAIAAGSMTRKWSTVLNGSAYNFADFKRQVDAAFTGH